MSPFGLPCPGPLLQPGSRAEIPFPWEQRDGRPLIDASLGTLQNRQLGLFALGGGCTPQDLPPLATGRPVLVAEGVGGGDGGAAPGTAA